MGEAQAPISLRKRPHLRRLCEEPPTYDALRRSGHGLHNSRMSRF